MTEVSTETLRQKCLEGAYDSLKFLEEYSNDLSYQEHLFKIRSLLITTEQCLSIERYKNNNKK